MTNGQSRAKGVRGERDIRRRLGGRRVGVAYLRNPVDIDLGWAVIQVRNRSQGGAAIHDALKAMENVTSKGINKYLIFKGKRGKWIVCEFLEQFEADRGARIIKDNLEGNQT